MIASDRFRQWDLAANRWVDEFTNFLEQPILMDLPEIGVFEAASGEHAFQAGKFLDPDERQHVLDGPGPRAAKQRGKDRKKQLRPGWDSGVSVVVMQAVVQAKVEQYPNLHELLYRIPVDRLFGGSEDAPIIEVTAWNDTIWGTTAGGRGANQLGQIWMERRSLL